MFVCQVPQLSGFKLWGGHVCLQYLPQVEMCGCLLLKCCACHRFKLWCGHVCFWNIVPATGLLAAKVLRPATGLSFWNIGPAALRDLLNTPRSPAAMLRQCEMDWSCHMLLYSVPQQHCRRGCGVLRCPRKNYREKKCRITWRSGHGGHMVCSLFRKKDGTYRGTKICMALKLRSHTGHVSSFWTAGLHERNGYLGWWSSPAFFGFRSFSLDVYYIDSSPREPRFVLVPLRLASVASGRPRWASERLECQQTCFTMAPKTFF